MADNTNAHTHPETQMTDETARQAADPTEQAEQQTQDAIQADQSAEQAGADAAEQADATKDAAEDAAKEADQGAADADQDEAQQAQEAEQAADPTEQAEQKAAPDIGALQAQVLDAELRAAAAVAGVPANKLAYVTRLADRSQAEGADPAEYAAAQIKQILTDFPELAQQPGGTGSAGNYARKQEPTKDPFLQGFGG